jgi:hypothetical protein
VTNGEEQRQRAKGRSVGAKDLARRDSRRNENRAKVNFKVEDVVVLTSALKDTCLVQGIKSGTLQHCRCL